MKPHWKSFLNLCLKSKDADELSRLLDCFLTIEEKESITDRFSIVKALLENKLTQRDMSEKLDVSIAKITRGSNALKTIDPKLKLFLEKNIT
ncbi:MAG: trp operon repressor [Gammaproteobacteria bacterium]|nr:trp operon repressor [Gammaproteobacteria bacterium]